MSNEEMIGLYSRGDTIESIAITFRKRHNASEASKPKKEQNRLSKNKARIAVTEAIYTMVMGSSDERSI